MGFYGVRSFGARRRTDTRMSPARRSGSPPGERGLATVGARCAGWADPPLPTVSRGCPPTRAVIRLSHHPRAVAVAGLDPIAKLMQVHGLVLQRPPQPFDEDVVEEPAPAVHRERHARTQHPVGEGLAGELGALSVFRISGLARTSASSRAPMQNEVSIVLDNRQESTCRVAQSITATR